MLSKFIISTTLLSCLVSGYLVPHNFNPEVDDSIGSLEIPVGFSEDQFQQLVDDTFELIKQHNAQQQKQQQQQESAPVRGTKKLSDYKYPHGSNVQKDTFNVVNDLDDGVHSAPGVTNGMYVVVPDEKSGNFDIFYKKNSENANSEGSSHNRVGNPHVDNGHNVQRDTFNVENDLDEQAKIEEFNRLADDSNVKIENDTFNIKNDLDEEKSGRDKESL